MRNFNSVLLVSVGLALVGCGGVPAAEVDARVRGARADALRACLSEMRAAEDEDAREGQAALRLEERLSRREAAIAETRALLLANLPDAEAATCHFADVEDLVRYSQEQRDHGRLACAAAGLVQHLHLTGDEHDVAVQLALAQIEIERQRFETGIRAMDRAVRGVDDSTPEGTIRQLALLVTNELCANGRLRRLREIADRLRQRRPGELGEILSEEVERCQSTQAR